MKAKQHGWKTSKVILFWLGATLLLNSCSILDHHTSVTYNKSLGKAPYDVVIVPGLPYDSAKMNPLFKARVLWAKELYETGVARNIIFSGSAVHSPYIEGYIMKMMADSMGIPGQHTFIEDKALHTIENLKYGMALADKMKWHNVAVATDPIQALLLKKYTAQIYSHVSILPFSMKLMPVYYKTAMPNINLERAFVEDFIPLKNRIADEFSVQD